MSNVAQLIRNYPTPANGVALFWLGNSGFAFRAGNGQVIYIDPLLSDAVYGVNRWQRLQPPPFRPAEADCDLLLITHGHADHLDPDSVPGIAQVTRAPIAAPPSCVGRMVQ
ncbi:MAG: metal-dependent hydrolase, partial [Firmicutes bacterium]|nr:metal-dependent hydrolase [Bacillota bacterium]